ncbi:unnamed protein product [Meloidogyne enterolobii]|uniref:Uncharacterized protein n=1 Tax=Meloidogyne enterolobii TaxID=390850 RepID=A0ACB0ZLG2_MELEN
MARNVRERMMCSGIIYSLSFYVWQTKKEAEPFYGFLKYVQGRGKDLLNCGQETCGFEICGFKAL